MTPPLLFLFAFIFISFCLYMINRTQSLLSQQEKRYCDSCSFPLKTEDTIPLYSWISLRGSCRYCQSPIGYKYIIWELTCLALLLTTSYILGFYITFLLLALTIIAITDLRVGRIPTLWVVLAGILAFFSVQPINVVLAIALAGTAYLIRQMFDSPPIGRGDGKFLAMAGLWLSLSQLPLFLVITGIGGVLTSLILKRRMIPLGPALCVALGICVLLGKQFDLLQYVSGLLALLP